nr:hypothetical protein [Tanacetum cinerariifolium]
MEDCIRSDLHFDDAKGTACLLNEAIFEGLAHMGAKTTAWNEFSSTMASPIICLADNQKFNFSKYNFDNMVKSLEGGVKFYLFLIFLQVFLDKQVEGMARHKEMYIISSHTEKIFANIRRIGAVFWKQNPRRKQRKEEEVSNDELEDENHVLTPSSDPLPNGEDSSILNELMVFVPAYKNRMIKEINQNADIALDDETQGRTNDDEMFGADDLAREEVVMETITGVKDSAAPITDVTKDEVIMAQTLVALKSIKLKVVDKGKAKMIEPKVPIKRKEQIRIDEEYARKLEAKEQEASRLSRAQQYEEANNSWDNMQAMMDADRLLAKKLQVRERKELSEVQKARLLVELIEKKKKHFAALRAQEKRNKPPTKTQMKSQMSTYLKHIGRYKQSHLKGRSFDELKKLFDREMTKVNDFITMDSEAQESSTKSTAEHLESEISKKQKVGETVELVVNDFKELRNCIKIVPDDGDKVLIEATPISSKSPTIIDYKIHKEGKKTYFKIIRADVKDRFKKEKPVDDMDNILFRTLKTMFEHHVEDTIWKYQQGLAKVYPLTRNTLHQLWSDVRLQVDYDVKMAYDLLRFVRK